MKRYDITEYAAMKCHLERMSASAPLAQNGCQTGERRVGSEQQLTGCAWLTAGHSTGKAQGSKGPKRQFPMISNDLNTFG